MSKFFVRFYFWVSYILKKVLAFGEAILFLRLALEFLGANPAGFLVFNLYKFTDFLNWPFESIFPNTYLGDRFLDVVTLSAMVGYLVLYFIVVRLLALIARE